MMMAMIVMLSLRRRRQLKLQSVCSFADVKANVKLDVPVTSSVFLVKDNVNVIALLICDVKYRDIEHGNLFSIPCKCKCDCTLDL